MLCPLYINNELKNYILIRKTIAKVSLKCYEVTASLNAGINFT